MCHFLSAIVFKNGDIWADPEHTDSHSELIAARGLEDGDKDTHIRRWIRVEYSPELTEKAADLNAYRLRVDETSRPDWFDADAESKVVKELARRIKAAIVDYNRSILLGGWWIVVGNAKVDLAVNARIILVGGKAKVNILGGSIRVGVMWESSNVGEMWGSSNVGVMRGSSNVGVMRGSSNVGVMWDSSKVGVMRGSSNVGVMWDSSKVGVMQGLSKVVTDNRTRKA